MNKKIWLAAMCFLGVVTMHLHAENMLYNGDFELADPEKPEAPAGWTYGQRWSEGGHYWITDDVRSGARAVRLEAVSYNPPEGAVGTGNISISSRAIPAPAAHTLLDVSAWVKAEDVISPGSYHKLRFVIYFWDAEGQRIRHSDIFSTDGSLDWTKINSTQRVPEGAATISVMFGLTACIGTGWIDDVRVTVQAEPLTEQRVLQEAGAVTRPVIVPQPWKMNVHDGQADIVSLAIRSKTGDVRVRNAIEKYFDGKIVYKFLTGDEHPEDSDSLFILGDLSDEILSQRLRESFPAHNRHDLGDEGYFLSLTADGGRTVIYLGGNTECGRFYGIQSLRQILEQDAATSDLTLLDIIDKPTVSRRGIAMGSHWFTEREQAIERLAALKGNMIHSQGSFLGSKFGGNHGGDNDYWRQMFTANEIATLRRYQELAEANFIDVFLYFSPRRGNPPIRYSSEEDINIVVEKMSALYDAGFRNFGLNYDDLQNIGMERLTEQVDIEQFGGDIGKAHYHYTLEVFQRLRARHSDVAFGFLPLWYGSFVRMTDERKDYLRTAGRLPGDIIFVSCPNDDANLAAAAELTGRNHLVWDNYFAGWERGGAPVFVPPIDRSTEFSDRNLAGYIFLPMIPANEDAAMTSWMTGADYMWSPERYDSKKAFQRAAARAVGGVSNVSVLEEYYQYLISDIVRVELPHGEELQTLELRNVDLPDEREQRLAFLRQEIETLNSWKSRLATKLPEKLFKAVNKEIDQNLRNLHLINAEIAEKPFPVMVKKTEGNIDWSAAPELTGFYIMAGDGVRAGRQTRAYLLYDDENLYIKAVFDEPEPDNIKAEITERDRNVFADDSLEIFLDTNTDRKSYFHIAVNSIGTVYDARHGGFTDTDWQSDVQVETRVGVDSWTIEMAVPLADLDVKTIKPGDRWNFNFCRARFGAGREFSSYALLLRGGFHAPDRFWTLEFE